MLTQISVFVSPYKLRHTQIVNSTETRQLLIEQLLVVMFHPVVDGVEEDIDHPFAPLVVLV